MGVMKGESCMFAASEEVRLLFPAESVLRVAIPASGMAFEAGKDFYHEPGSAVISRLPGSAIPCTPESELYPDDAHSILYDAEKRPDANAIRGRVGGGNLIFGRGPWFSLHQIEVDYRPVHQQFPPLLKPQLERLPRFRRRLAAGEPLTVSFIGDSITQGWNATGFMRTPPFRSPYAEQVASALEQDFGCRVTLNNFAIGGTGCRQAADIREKWINAGSDLLVVAYGMNDFHNMTAEQFIAVLDSILADCRAESPETEFVLVNSMTGNPEWEHTPMEKSREFSDALQQYAASAPADAALTDVRAVWTEVLRRKAFYDLTGNGVNHPNDFGHRLYAAVFRALFHGQSSIFPDFCRADGGK